MSRWSMALFAFVASHVASIARATPADGALLGSVEVEDTDGGRRRLPDTAHPVAIIYEDQDASKRPQAARELFGTYTRRAENRAIFEFVAVADVSKWNWWPAKKYVFADIKKIATRNNTKVFLDWTGALRKAWGLRKGQSGVLLVGADGRVRFACEGALTDAQKEALSAALSAIGARPEGM
jgi:hypothetical protein